jgi:hypothetical protein
MCGYPTGNHLSDIAIVVFGMYPPNAFSAGESLLYSPVAASYVLIFAIAALQLVEPYREGYCDECSACSHSHQETYQPVILDQKFRHFLPPLLVSDTLSQPNVIDKRGT